MRWNVSNFMVVGICGLILVGGTVAIARQQQSGAPHVQQQTGAQQQTPPPVQQAAGAAQTPAIPAPEDPIKTIVGRLDLEKYKATIKGLTQFGDRREGTDRNRAAVDWIEAQLKSYGCTNTERVQYDYQPPAGRGGAGRSGTDQGGTGRGGTGQGNPAGQTQGPGGSRRRGLRTPDSVNNDPLKQPDVKLRELNSQPSAPGPREE